MNTSLAGPLRRVASLFKPQSPRGVLPSGDYYNILWGIPETFGGLTSASLERASAFARQDNRPVTILTFSPHNSGKEREQALKDEGRLDKRVSILNIWEDLSTWSDTERKRMKGTARRAPEAVEDVLPHAARNTREQRTDDAGAVLQTDHYDAQGRLLVIDRQDTTTRGTKGGRLLTLLNPQGDIIGQWRTATAFYKAWLDVVFGEDPSYVIVDSAFAGRLFHGYRRDNVIFCQVIHNAHAVDTSLRPVELYEGNLPLIQHLDEFDRGIALTDGQKNDLVSEHYTSGNVRVISNLIPDLHGSARSRRDRTDGQIIARLTGQKRLDHAVRAFARAKVQVPELSIDVYGEGGEQQHLTCLIEEEGITDSFRLRGHDTQAKSYLRSASFLVLSSLFEGQGLVLLESMSAGCIPIAYDIKYGPSDIITDSVDGFLVPAGDVDALAEAIVKVATMDDAALRTMRRNAIKRAKDFYEESIVRDWAQMFAECSFDPIQKSAATAKLTSLTVTDTALEIEAAVEKHPWEKTSHSYVSWRLAGKPYYGRTPAEFDGPTLRAVIPLSELELLPTGALELSADFVEGRSFRRTRILADETPAAAGSFFTPVLNDKGQLNLQIEAD
ncbi:glycosyltransferase [Brevibacterium sp. HMSC22B09]|uniref:glycosyltransferase n=1 Tax=Brevibacterium sp. HMSC22B09 TaxID=1581055 RepID=UPI0008A2D78B|nr:glycosyltransferase [Brevibacterium sp. HMSC22B09]OFT97932.1 hypothetical protein HMPREF3087_03605 [Brevibacterium sp. HMSC22B09]